MLCKAPSRLLLFSSPFLRTTTPLPPSACTRTTTTTTTRSISFVPQQLTPTTEPRDPRKPPRSYTQRSTTPARRPDARLTPYSRTPRVGTRGLPPPTRPTKVHQKRIFIPHSPLPMPWLGKAPAGTKPYDPQNPPIFHVGRTGSQNLPVYVERAGTPNLRVAVRRVTGSKPALARALTASFGFDPDKVISHPTSAQVIIKGAGPIERERITDWLTIKGF